MTTLTILPLKTTGLEPVSINTATKELSGQLDYLVELEFRAIFKRMRKPCYFLLAWTIFLAGFFLLTDSNKLIGYKAVLSAFTSVVWLLSVAFLLVILIRRYNRTRWKNKTLAYTSSNGIVYLLSFDTEKITYVTNTYRSELNWEYYTYWAENNDSIFIFKEQNFYTGLYYSRSELGNEHYAALKEIVAKKLVRL